MRKRSITIHGHQTSISLEDEFWQELAAIAQARDLSLNALVTEIDKARRRHAAAAAIFPARFGSMS